MFGLPVRPGDREVNRVAELTAVTRADGLLFKRMGGAVFPASACRRSAQNCPAGPDALGRPDPVLLGYVHLGTVGVLSLPPRQPVPILVKSQRIIVGLDLVSISPAPDGAVGIRPGGGCGSATRDCHRPPAVFRRILYPRTLVVLMTSQFRVTTLPERVAVKLWLLQVSASLI